jgi:hypothetical protein
MAGGGEASLNYLEKRAQEKGGELSPEAMAALRRGWYLGDESFRDRLLGMLEKSSGVLKKKGSHSPDAVQSHGETEAGEITRAGERLFEIKSGEHEGEPKLRKGDARKVAIAILLKRRTNVGNQWIAERLEMGHNQSVGRLVKQGNEDRKIKSLCRKLEKMSGYY